FLYGLILDVTTRTIAELREELAFILRTPEITLPSYVSLPIPLLGTQFFKACLRDRRILPNTRLRDCDGTTLTLWPKDPLSDVLRFVADMRGLEGLGAQVALHATRFMLRYGRRMDIRQAFA